MPGVFIGVPTLNRPEYVRETVRSLQRQTHKEFRAIVSDNCSEGKIADSVEGFIRGLNDPRFTFYRQPRDGGEYGQGRFFFRQAGDDEFFAILHDDDVFSPTYLEKGIERLSADPGLACFVANPFLMDGRGEISREKGLWYRRQHGREKQPEGVFDILRAHLEHGFTPISGTLFRTDALRRSGFVDEDFQGTFPFESNIFLRLGECGERGWFCPEELLGFRFHNESLRSYLRLLENPVVVDALIRLFARRRFSGSNERRRRVILGRLFRAQAMIRVRGGDVAGCRQSIRRALTENPGSIKTSLSALAAFAAPFILRSALSPAPEVRSRPRAGAGGDTTS